MRTRVLLIVFGLGVALALAGCPAFNPNPPHPGEQPAEEPQAEPLDGGASDAEDEAS
jgi:hypothetical protein